MTKSIIAGQTNGISFFSICKALILQAETMPCQFRQPPVRRIGFLKKWFSRLFELDIAFFCPGSTGLIKELSPFPHHTGTARGICCALRKTVFSLRCSCYSCFFLCMNRMDDTAPAKETTSAAYQTNIFVLSPVCGTSSV